MRQQRNMSQMKGQKKTPQKELNETVASNLPDTKFKTLAMSVLKEHSECFGRGTESIKRTRKPLKTGHK